MIRLCLFEMCHSSSRRKTAPFFRWILLVFSNPVKFHVSFRCTHGQICTWKRAETVNSGTAVKALKNKATLPSEVYLRLEVILKAQMFKWSHKSFTWNVEILTFTAEIPDIILSSEQGTLNCHDAGKKKRVLCYLQIRSEERR